MEIDHWGAMLSLILMAFLLLASFPIWMPFSIPKVQASPADWYTTTGGWINVTKADWKFATNNSTQLMFYRRTSNTTAFQHASYGFIWSEIHGGMMTAGSGTTYSIYADEYVLSFKRVYTPVGVPLTYTVYFTFWKDKDYFAYETQYNFTSTKVARQPQVGITFPATATTVARGMDYKNGSYLEEGIRGQVTQITYETLQNNTRMPWISLKDTTNNNTVGWIPIYWNQPWFGINTGSSGALWELQLSTPFTPPTSTIANRYKTYPYIIQISTIVYPYYGDTANYHTPVYDLAGELYSTLTQTVSWGDLNYAFAENDGYLTGTTGLSYQVVANPIGFIHPQTTYEGGFFLKNTTVWNYYGLQGSVMVLPFRWSSATLSTGSPHAILTNSTTNYNVRFDTAPTRNNKASNSTSVDGTQVWGTWQAERSEFLYNMTIDTWGDSDKFNVTLRFRNKIATNITDAYTDITVQNQINNIQFTQITTNITADYTILDPHGQYCGFLVKKLAGNGSWVDFDSNRIRFYYIDNAGDVNYPANSLWEIKLMFWAHYGQITNEDQITGWHTSPTLANTKRAYAKSAANSTVFQAYNLWNPSATFPIMKKVDDTHYNLTSIASGTKTFTIFLDTATFTDISNVVGADSYEYNAGTGNLTFTATYSNSKELQIILPTGYGFFATVELQTYNTQLQTDGNPYLTDCTGTITALLYETGKLIFTVSASTGITSTTQILVGDTGKPKEIQPHQADGGWNEATKTQTITWTHASSQEFQLIWETGGSGMYAITVIVSANYFPVSGATVSINNENKTTNLFGQTTWTLTFGDYVIWAYYQGKNQSQTVSINQDRTLGFNFTSNPPPPPSDNRILVITAIIIVATIIFLTFIKRRK